MKREWEMLVTVKTELRSGYYSLTLERPSDADIQRPYWTDKTMTGCPCTMNVTKEEFDLVSVGDHLTVTLELRS